MKSSKFNRGSANLFILIFIAGLFAKIFPQLREVDSLDPNDLVRKYQKMEAI